MHGVIMVLVAALVSGCGSRSVDVVDSHTDLHLSGNWSDADSRAVAEQVGQRLAEAPWIADFVAEHGRAPVLRVGRVVVRTRALDDLVDPTIVTNDLTRALIASGKVRVVADRAETAVQGRERQDLADHAAQPVAQRAGLAADVILGGTLLTQDDRVLDRGLTGTYRQVKFYQFDLVVTALGSNEVLWRDSVERKKTIEQSTTGW